LNSLEDDMGNSNSSGPADSPDSAGKPGFMSGHRSQQGPGGGARQFDAAGNLGIAAAAPLTSARSAPPAQIVLAQAQEMALRITTGFEGGKPMNYQALADDFDHQGMSFGLLQWNFGQNTLGPLLNQMMAKDGAAFAGCFGPTTNYAVLQAALEHDDQAAQLSWVRELQARDKPAWRTAFQAVGALAQFNAIQLAQAVARFHPSVMEAVGQLRLIAPALLSSLEFSSYAALFDLCVQQGAVTSALDAIRLRVEHEKPATQSDLLKIAVTERGRLANPQWRSDCISRRMGILTGESYKSTENGITKKRDNPQFALILQFGAAQIGGL
jgi:hypothetical protein